MCHSNPRFVSVGGSTMNSPGVTPSWERVNCPEVQITVIKMYMNLNDLNGFIFFIFFSY